MGEELMTRMMAMQAGRRGTLSKALALECTSMPTCSSLHSCLLEAAQPLELPRVKDEGGGRVQAEGAVDGVLCWAEER